MKLLTAISLLVLILQATTSDEVEWSNFKIKYGKHYKTKAEEDMRKGIFHEMLEFVNHHNELYRQGKVTFKVGINKFADMSSEEFVQKMTGGKKTAANMRHEWQYNEISDVKDIPSSIDWRDYGYVTPVKDASECGTPWSIPVAEALEGQNFAATGVLVPLSYIQVHICSTNSTNCNTGSIALSYNYIKANGGLCCEDTFIPAEGACLTSATILCQCATCNNYTYIRQNDEIAVQLAVGTIGPVSTAIDASHSSFQLYTEGIYYEPYCSSEIVNQGVLITGYGNEGGQDFWLVKNSWGTSWGDDGYIKMSRNRENNCGIATEAAYPIS